MTQAALVSKFARPTDFADFLRYESPSELLKARKQLEAALKEFGEVKTTVSELLRERLSMIRRALATA